MAIGKESRGSFLNLRVATSGHGAIQDDGLYNVRSIPLAPEHLKRDTADAMSAAPFCLWGKGTLRRSIPDESAGKFETAAVFGPTFAPFEQLFQGQFAPAGVVLCRCVRPTRRDGIEDFLKIVGVQ